jgi:ABC-type maltose transport system permease subunit
MNNNNSSSSSMNVFAAYTIVAFLGVLGTVVVSLIVNANMGRWAFVSDSTYAVSALMMAIPAIMASAIALFIHRTHLAQLARHHDPNPHPTRGQEP